MAKIKYPPLSWLIQLLLRLGVSIKDLIGLKYKAYCDFESTPDLLLTSTYQKVTGWVPQITPLNITETNGIFESELNGIYSWGLERRYINKDKNPLNEIDLFIKIEKNGTPIFEKSAPIQAAGVNNEPSIISFYTPFIDDNYIIGDQYEIYVKADMSGINPESTKLMQMKLTAFKVYEK